MRARWLTQVTCAAVIRVFCAAGAAWADDAEDLEDNDVTLDDRDFEGYQDTGDRGVFLRERAGRDPRDEDRIAERSARMAAPRIGEVLGAAYRAAGLDRDLGRFGRRARLAGLIPLLSVRTGRDTSWRDDDPTIARGLTIDVRATWRLDRLVFDGRELQVAALEAARRREKRRLGSRVIHVFFAWRRSAGSASQARSAARAEETTAELDSLTDGWFSQAVERARRTASENRTVYPRD